LIATVANHVFNLPIPNPTHQNCNLDSPRGCPLGMIIYFSAIGMMKVSQNQIIVSSIDYQNCNIDVCIIQYIQTQKATSERSGNHILSFLLKLHVWFFNSAWLT